MSRFLKFPTEKVARDFSHAALVRIGSYTPGNTTFYLFGVREGVDGRWYAEVDNGVIPRKYFDSGLTNEEKRTLITDPILVRDLDGVD